MNPVYAGLAAINGWEPQQLAMLFIVALLAILGPVVTRRIRKMRQGDRKQAIEGSPGDPVIRLRRTADKAMVDLLETGREISAQLDTKIRVLNKLVKDAHDENRRLEALLRQAGVLREVGDVTPAPETPGDEAEENMRSPSGRYRTELHARIRQLHQQNTPPGEIARLTHLSLSEVNLALRLLDESAE